jgi:hypothetical protein
MYNPRQDPYHVVSGGARVDELQVRGRVLHHDTRHEAADAAEAVDAARHRRHGSRDGQGRSRAHGEREDNSGELRSGARKKKRAAPVTFKNELQRSVLACFEQRGQQLQPWILCETSSHYFYEDDVDRVAPRPQSTHKYTVRVPRKCLVWPSAVWPYRRGPRRASKMRAYTFMVSG